MLGAIYLVDLTMTAATLSTTSHNLVRHQSVVNRPQGRQLECGENGSVLVGHSKTVTSLCFSSSDNVALVSRSIDDCSDQIVLERILSLGISNLSVRYVHCPLP